MSAAIVLEDNLGRRNWFVNWLKPGPFFADTPEQAIRIYEIFKPRTILLDYDLGRGVSSEPFAHYLAASRFAGRTIVVSENPFGMLVLARILPSASVMPFPVLRRTIEQSWDAAGTEHGGFDERATDRAAGNLGE
jgi:hypothetical protein